VWIDPDSHGEFDVAIGARVKSIDGENICLVDDDNQVNHSFLLAVSSVFVTFYFSLFSLFSIFYLFLFTALALLVG